MSSSDSESPSVAPSLEELIRRQGPSLSRFLPLILRSATATPLQDRGESGDSGSVLGRIIVINPSAQSMIVIEGSGDLEAMFGELVNKGGPLPASKASIEAMPVVKMTEEGAECAICLEEYGVGEEGKEMPCKHRFHSGCIEKWLGIHGSCPVCRYKMPVEEDGSSKRGDGNGEGGRGGGDGGDIRVTFYVGGGGRGRRDSSSDPSAVPDSDSGGHGDGGVAENGSDMEIDSN